MLLNLRSLFVICFLTIATKAQNPRLAPSNLIKGRPLTPEEGCGHLEKIPNVRIVGGTPAERGMFPWMALLAYNRYGAITFDCGGSLITTNLVVTASHCIIDELFSVRLGEHDFAKNDNILDITVYKAHKHPDYDPDEIKNDIAIVVLPRHVNFTKYIRPICLPLHGLNIDYVGYNPFVAGWGLLHEDGERAKRLQMLQIPVLHNKNCADLYEKNPDADVKKGYFDDRVICAGFVEGARDSCQGDSGGPLMLPLFRNGTFPMFQIGVVSWGYGCARANTPGIYSRVEYFMDFIQQKIEENKNNIDVTVETEIDLTDSNLN